MPRAAFKQRDVERLLRAAKAVGYLKPTVEKRPDGTLRLLTDAAPANADDPEPANEWDEVLPR